MRRRAYLGTLVTAAAVAGCSTSDDGDADPDSTGGETNSPPPTSEPTPTPEPEPEPEPEIVVGQLEMKSGLQNEAYEAMVAAPTISNEGDAPSARVNITIDWLDGDRNYLASSQTQILTLGPGQTWLPRVSSRSAVEDLGEVAGYNVSVGEVTAAEELNPDGIFVSDSELRTSDQEVLVQGDVTNERDNQVQYLLAVVKVLNAEGAVIGTGVWNETALDAGSTSSFEVSPDTMARNGDINSVEILLSTSKLWVCVEFSHTNRRLC